MAVNPEHTPDCTGSHPSKTPRVPLPRITVSWLPRPRPCSLSWSDLLGAHLAHLLGAPEAWVWPV